MAVGQFGCSHGGFCQLQRSGLSMISNNQKEKWGLWVEVGDRR